MFKLKTDMQRLQSQIDGKSESEQKLKIQYERDLTKAQMEKQVLSSRVRSLEQELQNQRKEMHGLRQVIVELQTAFLPEKEALEKGIIELKMNDSDLRAKIADSEEEVKSSKLMHEHEELKMKHEIKCLNLELESVRTANRLLESSNTGLKSELADMLHLKSRMQQLESENKSLNLSLNNYQESVELRHLFHEDMDELKRLRQENAQLKETILRQGDAAAVMQLQQQDQELDENVVYQQDDEEESSGSYDDAGHRVQAIDSDISEDEVEEEEEVEVDECDSSSSQAHEVNDDSDDDIAEVSSD